jgi:UDPglucose--hexose-1-phosphate uridylyltransferase
MGMGMPQLRKDPLSDCWVIYAEGREQRPNEFERLERRRPDARCPFCAGHEEDTPPPLATYSAPADQRLHTGTDWSLRVVPNKYPALVTRGEATTSLCGMYELANGFGAHEVVIESPRHVASLTELTMDEARLTMTAYRDRMQKLRQVPGLRYALVFKNVGPEAGASLEHAHSQIVATPMIPGQMQQELTACRRWQRARRKCFFCEVLADELAHRQRLVAESPHFVAVCPYASRLPYELWVLPRAHQSHFERQEDEVLAELGLFLQDVLRRLESLHEHLAYNYFLHTAPFDASRLRHYHWHVEVLPRLTTTAGFEWGAGYFINPVPPEQAAANLRSAGAMRG